MMILGLLVLIALGLLGVASWLRAQRPELQGPLQQLQSVEGWVGVVGLAWGLIGLLQWLTSLAAIAAAPVTMLIALASLLVTLALSLIFALPLLKTWLGANDLSSKLSDLAARLAPQKLVLGAICLAFAAYTLLRVAI